MRFYVSIKGLEPSAMAFFGLQIAEEDQDFILYVDRDGEEHLVDKKSPHIFVEDINDARYIMTQNALALQK